MILVIGGARSGKSSFAEEKAKKIQEVLDSNILYLATSIPFDEGMKDRIKKHRASRPSDWLTIEQYKNFNNLVEKDEFRSSSIILLDCLTLMISNILLEYKGDFDKISMEEIDELENEIQIEVDNLVKLCNEHGKELIVVSNEVGLGLVPPYKLGSIFRDISGKTNQFIAKYSKEVFLLTAGIPLKIK